MKKTIEELEELFNADLNASRESLDEFKESLEYYHSNQLPQDVKETIANRGQVEMTENLFKMICNKILGYKIQSMQEVKVSGRQEEDKALANLLNDLLKVFSDNHSYNKEIIKRDLHLLLGIAVVEVQVTRLNGDYDVEFKSIMPNCFLIDKYSTDKNALDARRFHKTITLSLEDAKEILGNKAYKIFEEGNFEKRVHLVESWYKEKGSWNRYIWYPNLEIYLYEKSPFANTHPFIVAKYNTDHNNHFYGIFREIKPLQDYVNFAENRMSNMLGSFKAFYESGAVADKEEFVNSASLDNSFTEVTNGGLEKIKFIENKADIAIISQKVNEKRQLAKMLTGITDEVIGMGGSRQSGSAIAQRRDAGLMSLQDFISCSDNMDMLMFSKVILCITHYFTRAQVFKIVDKKVGERYFSINTNPNNRIRVGQWDLSYKTTLKMLGREERFTHWSEIFKTISSVRPDLVAPLLPLMLKDTESPIVADIEEILAQSEESAAQAQQAQMPLQQQAQQLEMANAQAKIAETQAKARKYNAQGALAENLAKGENHTKEGMDLR